MPVIQTVNIISQLATKYGLQYTKTLRKGQMPAQHKNPYDGQIDEYAAQAFSDYGYYDDPVAVGTLGTPVFTNIVFVGNTTNGKPKKGVTIYKDTISNKLYPFDDIEFQTVLLSVSQAKKIIKTEIQGRDGTVKEYIGMDDYQITINAILNGVNGHYPIESVATVKRMLDVPTAIEVQCDYLQNLGIYNIVIESYKFDQEEGMYSQQKITINCISDAPTILQLNNAYV